MEIKPVHKASCHCGSVELELGDVPTHDGVNHPADRSVKK